MLTLLFAKYKTCCSLFKLGYYLNELQYTRISFFLPRGNIYKEVSATKKEFQESKELWWFWSVQEGSVSTSRKAKNCPLGVFSGAALSRGASWKKKGSKLSLLSCVGVCPKIWMIALRKHPKSDMTLNQIPYAVFFLVVFPLPNKYFTFIMLMKIISIYILQDRYSLISLIKTFAYLISK